MSLHTRVFYHIDSVGLLISILRSHNPRLLTPNWIWSHSQWVLRMQRGQTTPMAASVTGRAWSQWVRSVNSIRGWLYQQWNIPLNPKIHINSGRQCCSMEETQHFVVETYNSCQAEKAVSNPALLLDTMTPLHSVHWATAIGLI